jgi:hypothetical protein
MPEIVGLEEAAKRLNISIGTVRRKLKTGELVGYKKPRPQGYAWEIELPDGVADHPTNEPASTLLEGSKDTAGEMAVLRELVATQKSQLESFERQLDVKDTQISELHVLLQTVQKTLPAPQRHRHWWWPFG